MQPLKFSFQFLNDQGQPANFLAKKGQLTDEELILDGNALPVAAIIDVDVRGQLLALTIATEGEPTGMVVKTSKANRLKSELGVLRSKVWVDHHQQELTAKGEAHRFRKVDCPSCHATLDLTDMEVTPQVHCKFCHTVSTLPDPLNADSPAADSEKGYRLCDECVMYSRPRQFTIFYFYFLLLFYGWHSRQTWRCPGCMRGEAWKMLFGNLIFVLGVPVAIIQLFRAYGGTDVGGRFRGLDSANLKARSGDFDAAIEAYQGILKAHPIAAGVKYNIAVALLQQQRTEEAARMLEFALADCSNYLPAAGLLADCYEKLGRTEDLSALKKRWHVIEEVEAEPSDAPE